MIERLKFRAKWLLSFGDVKQNDWVHAGVKEEYSLRGFFADIDRKRLDPATVGQWIGYSDEYGQDIYEGDLVMLHGLHEFPFRVEFRHGVFVFTNNALCTYAADIVCDKSVIGNIHDKAVANET